MSNKPVKPFKSPNTNRPGAKNGEHFLFSARLIMSCLLLILNPLTGYGVNGSIATKTTHKAFSITEEQSNIARKNNLVVKNPLSLKLYQGTIKNYTYTAIPGPIDTIPYYEEEEYTLPGMLPEYDFYAYWDTLHVDAYRFNLKNLTEEVPLILLESDCNFTMPIFGRTNSTYGWRHGRPHTGIDLQLSTGDSVFAAFDGVVRMSRYYNGYGYCVVVRHYNGLETLYAHLSKLSVSCGTLINAGQLVGLGGSTGHSTGPHLHFETRFLGRPLNPALVIDFQNHTIKSDTLFVSQSSFQMPYSKTSVKSRYKKRRGYYKRSYRKSRYRRR